MGGMSGGEASSESYLVNRESLIKPCDRLLPYLWFTSFDFWHAQWWYMVRLNICPRRQA